MAVDPSVMQNIIQDSLVNAAEKDVDMENDKEANIIPKTEEKHEEPMDSLPDEANQPEEHKDNQ